MMLLMTLFLLLLQTLALLYTIVFVFVWMIITDGYYKVLYVFTLYLDCSLQSSSPISISPNFTTSLPLLAEVD